MNFKFSKELIESAPTNRPNNQLRLYKVTDEKDQLLGQFFYYPKRQIIRFDHREISIEVVSKFLKRTKYILVDKENSKQLGEYEIFRGLGNSHFLQDVPSSPTGTIKLGDTVFNFKRMPPEIKHSFLRQETWGNFKFLLYAIKGNEFYEYSLKMNIPVWSKPDFTKYSPFIGTIEANSDNVFAILAGLYLMEVEFDLEDTKSYG